jgi:glycosyltransferase involved in cell wall biosynthesis
MASKARSIMIPLPFGIPNTKGKFVIVCVGRLSKEKKQMLLVKAISLSQHEKDIQLVLCGEGPGEKQILRYAKKRLDESTRRSFSSTTISPQRTSSIPAIFMGTLRLSISNR